jgi:hypothetical protein
VGLLLGRSSTASHLTDEVGDASAPGERSGSDPYHLLKHGRSAIVVNPVGITSRPVPGDVWLAVDQGEVLVDAHTELGERAP